MKNTITVLVVELIKNDNRQMLKQVMSGFDKYIMADKLNAHLLRVPDHYVAYNLAKSYLDSIDKIEKWVSEKCLGSGLNEIYTEYECFDIEASFSEI